MTHENKTAQDREEITDCLCWGFVGISLTFPVFPLICLSSSSTQELYQQTIFRLTAPVFVCTCVSELHVFMCFVRGVCLAHALLQ